MDSQKFDILTRAIATGTSRRTILKFIGGGALAASFAAAVPRTDSVLAQQSGPGGECGNNEDCTTGLCYTSAEAQVAGVCYCEDPNEPWRGCTCETGTEAPCGDTTLLCCAESEGIGVPGICTPSSVGCEPRGECTAPGENCEESGCCELGDQCAANGFCLACISGTQNPCGSLSQTFGVDFVCCIEEGAAPGSTGVCVPEQECIGDVPDTGSGLASGANNWIVPAAALGAAAAVMGWRNREKGNKGA